MRDGCIIKSGQDGGGRSYAREGCDKVKDGAPDLDIGLSVDDEFNEWAVVFIGELAILDTPECSQFRGNISSPSSRTKAKSNIVPEQSREKSQYYFLAVLPGRFSLVVMRP